MQKVKCDICGEEVKNLGLHKYHKHKENISQVVVDEYLPDKQLSDLISEMRSLLKRYSNELTVKTVEVGGVASEVEILARIQLRR